jgi:serine/threonine protein kinase
LELRDKLSETEAKSIFRQVLEAVNFCHSKGIIHRDIKLENILFSDENKTKIKIIDFGVSGLVKSERSKCGTLRYMPPEVITGSNTNSLPSIDVWGLGCILYELLTGEVLFKGNTRPETRVSINITKDLILKGANISGENISIEACHLLNKLLENDINDRISIDQALQHPWLTNEALDYTEEVAHIVNRSRKRFKTEVTKTNYSRSDSKAHRSLWDKYFGSEKKRDSGIIFNNLEENLPTIATKISSNVKDFEVYEHNVALTRKYGGRVPSYLQPIGHSKVQKQHSVKAKEYLDTRFSTIETSSKRGSSCASMNYKAMRTISQFQPAKLDPKVIKSNILKNVSNNQKFKLNLNQINISTIKPNSKLGNLKNNLLFLKKM